MDKTDAGDLKTTYRSEKDLKVRTRILAAHMIRVHRTSVNETTVDLMQSERWIHNWLKWYDKGDLDSFRDLPRTGRPPKVLREIIDEA